MYDYSANELLEKIKEGNYPDSLLNEYIFKETCEFVEEMAKTDYKDAKSQVRRLFKHLIKYKYQPNRQSRSWINTIDNAVVNLQNDLEDDNVLKNKINNDIDHLYILGVKDAARETGLDRRDIEEKENNSNDLPYNIDDLIDEDKIYDFMIHYATSSDAKKELKKRGYL